MPRRRPQINFQVGPSMKSLYDEARASGHWVTRWCAAGLLMMVERPELRREAISRLRHWEADFCDASEEEIHEFVAQAEAAMTDASQETPPAPRPPKVAKKAKRRKSS